MKRIVLLLVFVAGVAWGVSPPPKMEVSGGEVRNKSGQGDSLSVYERTTDTKIMVVNKANGLRLYNATTAALSGNFTGVLLDSVLTILGSYDISALIASGAAEGNIIKYNATTGEFELGEDLTDSLGSWTIVSVDTTIKFTDSAGDAIIQIHNNDDTTQFSWDTDALFFMARVNITDAVRADSVIGDTLYGISAELDTIRVNEQLNMSDNEIVNVAHATADTNAANWWQIKDAIGDTAALRLLIDSDSLALIHADTLVFCDGEGNREIHIDANARVISTSDGGRFGVDSMYIDSGGVLVMFNADRSDSTRITFAIMDSVVRGLGRFNTVAGAFTELNDSSLYWDAGGIDSGLAIHSDGDGSKTTITPGDNDTLQLGLPGLAEADSLLINDSLYVPGKALFVYPYYQDDDADSILITIQALEDTSESIRADIDTVIEDSLNKYFDTTASNDAYEWTVADSVEPTVADTAGAVRTNIRDTVGVMDLYDTATTAALGVAQFHPSEFSVTGGIVQIINSGITNAKMADNAIGTAEIANQTIVKVDIDTTMTMVFAGLALGTSANADSLVPTKNWVDSAVGAASGIFTEVDDSIAYWDGNSTDSALTFIDCIDTTKITPGDNSVLQVGVPGIGEADSLKINDSLYAAKAVIDSPFKGDDDDDSLLVTKHYVDNLDWSGNLSVTGNVTVTGKILQWNHAARFSHDNVWAPHADTPLYIDTDTAANPGCEDDSRIVHVDVEYAPEGWNGWQYLMAFTPYGIDTASGNISNADENPCLAASNDGQTWEWFHNSPSGGDGDTIANPIIRPANLGIRGGDPDTIFYGDDTLTVQYLSDVDLKLWKDDSLYLFFRASYKDQSDAGNKGHAIWVMRSADGLTWVDTMRLFHVEYASENARQLVSPSVVVDTGDVMSMYYTTDTGDAAGHASTVVRRQASNPLDSSQWQANCDTINWVASGNRTVDYRMPWHLDVKTVLDEFQAFVVECDSGSGGDNSKLHFATSSDGYNWTTSERAILEKSNITVGGSDTGTYWYNKLIYRASGIPTNFGDKWGYQLWYPAATGDFWRVGYTEVYFEPRDHWFSLESVAGRTTAPTDSVWLLDHVWDASEGGAGRRVLFVDSTSEGSDTDWVVVTGTAPTSMKIDTILYWYKTNGAIDSVIVYMPPDSTDPDQYTFAGIPYQQFADSIYYVDTTDRTSASWAQIKMPFDHTIYAGEQMAIRFKSVLADDNDKVKVLYITVKGRPIWSVW